MELVRDVLNDGYTRGFWLLPYVSAEQNHLGNLTGGSPSEGRVQVGGYSDEKQIEIFGINAALELIRNMISLFAVVDPRPTPLAAIEIEHYAVVAPLALVSSNRAGTEETSLPGSTKKVTAYFTRFKTTVQLNMTTIWSANEGDPINAGIVKELIRSMAVRIAQSHLRTVFEAFKNTNFATQHPDLTGVLHRTTAANEIISAVLRQFNLPNILPKGDAVVVMPAIVETIGNLAEGDNKYGSLIAGMAKRVAENVVQQFYNQDLLQRQRVFAAAANIIYPTDDPEKFDTYTIGAGNRKIPLVYSRFLPAENENGGVSRTKTALHLAFAMHSTQMGIRAPHVVRNLPATLDIERLRRIVFLIDDLTVGARDRYNGGAAGVNAHLGGPNVLIGGGDPTLTAKIAHIFARANVQIGVGGAPTAPLNVLVPAGAAVNAPTQTGTNALETAAAGGATDETYDAHCLGLKRLLLDPLTESIESLLVQGSFPGIVCVFQEQQFTTHPTIILLGGAKIRLAWHQLQIGRKEDEIQQTDTRQIVSEVAAAPSKVGGLNRIQHSFISSEDTYNNRDAGLRSAKIMYNMLTGVQANSETVVRAFDEMLQAAMHNNIYQPGDFIAIGVMYSNSAFQPYGNMSVAERFGPPAMFRADEAIAREESLFNRVTAAFLDACATHANDESVEHVKYETCQQLPICRGSDPPSYIPGTLLHTYNTYVVGKDRQTQERQRSTTV